MIANFISMLKQFTLLIKGFKLNSFLWFPYEFSLLLSESVTTLFQYILHESMFVPNVLTDFLFSLSDVRLPKLLCFYNLNKHSSQLLIWIWCCTLKTMWLIVLHKFLGCAHLTMSMIVLSFSQLVLHTHEFFQSTTSTPLPPTTVCLFSHEIVPCNNKAWLHHLTGGYLETPSHCYLYLHLQHNDP